MERVITVTASLLPIFPPISTFHPLSVHRVALGVSFNQVPSGASDIFPRKAFETLNEQSFQYNPCAQQLST